MSSARVTSLAALRDFKAAIQRFIAESSAALAEVEAESVRTSQWLRFDQTTYWAAQAHKRHDAVELAKSELRRRQMTGLDDSPTAIEHRRIVDRAKHFEDEARAKIERVRKWMPAIEREITLYKGGIHALSDALSRDLPAAMLRLDRMIAAIEAYASINQTPVEGMARAGGAGSDSAAVTPPRALTPEEAGAVHAPLRRRAVRQAVRDSITVGGGKPTLQSRAGDALEMPDIGLLAHLGLMPEPPRPDSKIILEHGALDSPTFFLQRLPLAPPTRDDDSGWHIGHGGPIVAGECPLEALTVEALTTLRPALAPLLDMPPGYLVLCIGGGGTGSDAAPPVVEAVLDPQDRQVFP
jgi:hypothetical protein